ncbi:LysR family transcriptional regulator [Eubacteriales bacterium DFI.9.88]|nr:LysR family transcriptional regulator [Eubacteriales bacterium DFI.9.88]
MDIKSLQYFIAVVESTSITKAAKALHISQPPLSHQLKQLEVELGTRLFDRGPRCITLTSAGETLYHRAKNIVDYTEETCREIKSIGDGNSGHISIGMISSLSSNLLSDILSQFCSKYPNVQFDIHEHNTYDLIESLDNNLIELAFVRTPFDNNHFSQMLLLKEPLVAYGHSSFFSDVSELLLEADFFQSKPLIIYRRWKYILDEYFKSEKVSPVYRCINDDAKSSLLLASSGQGIAIIPAGIANIIHDDAMRYLPMDAAHLATEVYAIWDSERYISPAASNFLQMLESFEIN